MRLPDHYSCLFYFVTSTVQPRVSSTLPVWMPVTVSYSFWLTSPMPPSAICITSFSKRRWPTGEMTAAEAMEAAQEQGDELLADYQ